MSIGTIAKYSYLSAVAGTLLLMWQGDAPFAAYPIVAGVYGIVYAGFMAISEDI